jgi:hypothetical protein
LSRIGSKNGYNVFLDAEGNQICLPDTSFIETATAVDILRERQQDPSRPWSEVVSFDEFVYGLLHWKEKTSTSPSGRHLGLYRALVTAHWNSSGEFWDFDPNSESELTTQEMAEQILELIHGLASAAASQGFYSRRWINVVNVMIDKKPGCIELDRLRVIHLFEADFNMMAGILFGRRAMHHQVNHKLLNPAQFGRSGGKCQDASISKVLHNLVCSFTHTPMGQFESDAKACFDREIMKFVLTCYKSTGAPTAPLRIWEHVLYNIVHKVKTGLGISTSGYAFTEASPIYGPGQGSRGGPGSCSTATSILIDSMAKLCHGLQFSDPSQQTLYTTTTNIFVDDASNCTNNFVAWLHHPPNLGEIVEMLRHDSQTWERLLWTLGGILNLLECAYCSCLEIQRQRPPQSHPQTGHPSSQIIFG